MLLNDFYTIIKQIQLDETNIQASICINKNHEVFLGHFPNNPVTPGVCMIQTIKEIVQNHVNSDLMLQGISNVKFTALINPEENSNLVLDLSIEHQDNLVKVKNITKFVDGTIALKCNGTFINI